MTGRYPDPRRSGTFCRELVDTLVEESSASERLRALSEPTQAGRPARAGRSACKDRFSPSPATGQTIRSAQGAFCAGRRLSGCRGPGPANRTKTIAPSRVGRYPQVVPILWIKGPRLFHRASCPALTEQGRAQELDTEGRPARDRYVWSAPAAPPGPLRSGRSAARCRVLFRPNRRRR
jgi:hypothetical protein